LKDYMYFSSDPIGHVLGQRVRIIHKRNRWVNLKILS